MKKIDKLILLDFIPPYLMAFFVAEFVLIMQFLWKYIDEIIGKGVSLGILIELIFYWGVRIIPEAVPVSILIASVMVFGNLAEKYELSSMKSSGISLIRIMAMGIFIAILTSLFSLLASNYLKPRANYKFIYRYNAIKRQKPALSIEEGIFNHDFRDITIRVGKKGRDGKSISDIMIYDHSVDDKRDINMLIAESGRMYAAPEEDYFIMELNNGQQYRELRENKKPDYSYPNAMVRTKFESYTKVFDMSEFDLEAQSINLTRKKYDLLNASQLREAIDSFNRELKANRDELALNFPGVLSGNDEYEEEESEEDLPIQLKQAIESQKRIVREKDRPIKKYRKAPARKDSLHPDTLSSIVQLFEKKDMIHPVTTARHRAERNNDRILKSIRNEGILSYSKALYVLRLNQQYSWALICILFLFIGASLGSIVKKGGYGYPLLVAIIFFMLFIILNIMGEKLTKSLTMGPVLGAWLPYIFMFPFAVILTYKALNDSNFSYVRTLINKFISDISTR